MQLMQEEAKRDLLQMQFFAQCEIQWGELNVIVPHRLNLLGQLGHGVSRVHAHAVGVAEAALRADTDVHPAPGGYAAGFGVLGAAAAAGHAPVHLVGVLVEVLWVQGHQLGRESALGGAGGGETVVRHAQIGRFRSRRLQK